MQETLLAVTRESSQSDDSILATSLRRQPESISSPSNSSNSSNSEEPPAPVFTARQEEIARLVAHGLSNLEIAERLHTKEATVKSHLQNIFRKTGIQRRSQLIGLFLTLATFYPDS